jgi:hypothetical protein
MSHTTPHPIVNQDTIGFPIVIPKVFKFRKALHLNLTPNTVEVSIPDGPSEFYLFEQGGHVDQKSVMSENKRIVVPERYKPKSRGYKFCAIFEQPLENKIYTVELKDKYLEQIISIDEQTKPVKTSYYIDDVAGLNIPVEDKSYIISIEIPEAPSEFRLCINGFETNLYSTNKLLSFGQIIAQDDDPFIKTRCGCRYLTSEENKLAYQYNSYMKARPGCRAGIVAIFELEQLKLNIQYTVQIKHYYVREDWK